MFKTFAAATATVALALGLSLVAIAPANADDTVPPPDPATSTTDVTQDPSTAPSEDPSTAPSDEPSTAPSDEPSNAPQGFSLSVINTDVPPQDHSHNPVTLCHATPADTAAEGWHSITVDDDAVFKEGHAYEHDADIIPAFYYWTGSDKDGWTQNHFDGKNLGTDFFGHTGQEILDAGCNVGLTASAVVTPETCTDDALVPGYITVTLSDYLSYSIDNGASFDGTGKTGPLVTGGTYTVTVKVLPKYKDDFTVTPTSFVLTITAFDGQCGEVGASVAPAAAATNQTCNSDDPENEFKVNGYITVFTLDKISYVITADSDLAQNHIAYDSVTGKTGPLAPGDYTIVPTAKPTFELSSTDALHRTIAAFDGKCQLPTDVVVIPLAVQKDPGCSANDSYTLSNNVGDPLALTWTVNGSTVAEGTYKVTGPATLKVHAAANGPTYGLDGTPQTDWTFTFGVPVACGDLKTLALTGTDDGTPLLAASAMLMLLGFALVRSGLRIRRRPVEAS